MINVKPRSYQLRLGKLWTFKNPQILYCSLGIPISYFQKAILCIATKILLYEMLNFATNGHCFLSLEKFVALAWGIFRETFCSIPVLTTIQSFPAPTQLKKEHKL